MFLGTLTVKRYRSWAEVFMKNKCVIALMRKLAKALWHLARGSTFDPTKLFNLKAIAGV